MTVTVSVPPPTALLPLQAPLAVQEVGVLVADQVIVDDAPAAREVGLALIVTTGTGVDGVPPPPLPPPQAARVRDAASGANLIRFARRRPRERA